MNNKLWTTKCPHCQNDFEIIEFSVIDDSYSPEFANGHKQIQSLEAGWGCLNCDLTFEEISSEYDHFDREYIINKADEWNVETYVIIQNFDKIRETLHYASSKFSYSWKLFIRELLSVFKK